VNLSHFEALVVFALLAAEPMFSQTDVVRSDVTQTTLDNGLRVVIIRDPLAPVERALAQARGAGERRRSSFPRHSLRDARDRGRLLHRLADLVERTCDCARRFADGALPAEGPRGVNRSRLGHAA
jgi:hypothetical protein